MATLNDNALTTLTAVKDRLGITTSSEDAFLIRTINRISDVFEKKTGRKWYNTDGDYTENVASFDRTRLQVNDHLPLTSITSITFDDGEVTTTIDASDYDIEDADAGFIRRLSGAWTGSQVYRTEINTYYVPETNEPNWDVVYRGGYITPKQEDDGVGTRDLPYDIEEAVIGQVITYNDEKTRNKNVKSLKVGSGSITWSDASSTGTSYAGYNSEFEDVIRSYQIHYARFV